MFTQAHTDMIANAIVVAVLLLIPLLGGMFASGFKAMTRRLDGIEKETKGAKARGTEIQANVRRIANGRSVHHEQEAAEEGSAVHRRRRSDRERQRDAD